MLSSMVRRFTLGATLLIASMVPVGVAAAYTDQAYLALETSGSLYKGTRVTIANPDSSQAYISNGDFFVTSSYADDGEAGTHLFQQGVDVRV